MVKSGQGWSGVIVCKDATGALSTPSVGPAGSLYINGVANAASVTFIGTNPYKWSVTLPVLSAGDGVSMYVTATIANIATATVVREDTADTKLVSDLNDVALADIAASVWNRLTSALTAVGSIGKALADLLAVFNNNTRTLTQAITSTGGAVSAGTLATVRGDTLSRSITGLGDLTGFSKLWFTVKQSPNDADTAAIIQALLSSPGGLGDGLQVLNGAVAADKTQGSITVNSLVSGNITIAMDEAATAQLRPGNGLVYDIQIQRAGNIATLAGGWFNIDADVTRAVS